MTHEPSRISNEKKENGNLRNVITVDKIFQRK
jgi:hypothetical protein